MPTSNKTILETANAFVTRGDYEGFLAHCTDDTHWTFVGDRTLDGKEAVRQYMAETYTEPPTFHVTDSIEEGDYVTTVGEITLPENGTPTRYAYCDVWRLRDGKLADLRAFVVKL